MKLKPIIIVFLLAAFSAKAQQYQVFTAATDKGIRVKWLSKTLAPNTSFNLYRKDDSGWQKINGQPITASPVIKKSELTTASNPFPKDSAYALYVEYKNNTETSPNKQAYADYTLAMAAVFDNRLAAHMGIYFEDTSVEKGKKYQYRLVQSDKELAVSNMVALGDLAAAPIEFQSKQEKQDVKFGWKVDEAFISYNLYRNGTKINTDPILANLEGKTYLVSFRDEKIKPGNYKYTVKGVTFLGTESTPSAEIAIAVKDLTPPSAIKGFKVERKENEVVMGWTASADKDLMGYNIFKSTDKGKTFQKINAQPIEAKTTQFNEKLAGGHSGTFQYYIEAMDETGNTTPSVKTSVFVPDHMAPNMPKSFTATSESGKITLSWAANAEKDLAGYRIYRGLKDDDENSMLLLNVNPQVATTFIDTFPKKAKTKFLYKIAAIDKSFNQSPKAAAWVTLPDIVPPNAPVLQQPVKNGDDIQLKWEPVVGDAILGYEVYRIDEGRKTKLNDTKITAGMYTDKGLPKKGLYQYYVQAVDSARLESKPSNSVYINTAPSEGGGLKLMAMQDMRTKKVQLEIVGIVPSEVQRVKLYRKDGDSGFRIVPFTYGAEATLDDTSEAGKIYEYFAEIIDQGDQKRKTDTINFNNP